MDKKTVFSYLVSIAMIIAIFLFFDLRKVIDLVLNFNVFFFIAAVFLSALNFPFRAMVWKLLVDPITKISFRDSFHIINISFFANFILPLRLGEIVRAFLLSELKGISKSVALSTVIINRLIESLVLVAFFAAGMAAFPFLGKGIAEIVVAIGIVFAGVLAVFLFQNRLLGFLSGTGLQKIIPEKFKNMAKNFLVGGQSLKKSAKSNFLIVFFTVIIWLSHVLAYFIVAYGLGIQLSVPQLFLIVSFSSLSAMIPSSPGFVGTFQAAFAAIFIALGLDAETGIGMSVILHAAAFISTAGLGIFSTNRFGVSLSQTFSRAKKEEKKPD